MFEFVKTPTGWRVFWGIDPHIGKSELKEEDTNRSTEQEVEVLSFRRPGLDTEKPSVA